MANPPRSVLIADQRRDVELWPSSDLPESTMYHRDVLRQAIQ